MLHVEGSGVLVNSIGIDRKSPGWRLGDATDGVILQHAAEPCTSDCMVSGQSANSDNGYAWIARHFLGQVRANIVQWDAVG